MAVYYKFKSEKVCNSIPMDVPFISVGTLKLEIFQSKLRYRGTDFDLVVTNAQTNEEYRDEAMLIPRSTSVLIRRVPGLPRLPIVVEQAQKVENRVVETEPEKISLPADDTSAMKYPEDSDWDEFGNDLYTIPDVLPVQTSNLIPEATPANKADEDSKIEGWSDAPPALDWQHPGSEFSTARGFGRGKGGRTGGGRGFGLELISPPQGYVCHRCKVPGHFIQHCPTNGDPNYDIKRIKQPTGIPRSMLMVNPHGSYVLPNGTVTVLKPNEAAFEKEIEGLPSTSTRSIGDLPPELHCPLCSDVMKDAALASKCCFKSFCDKCIRDYIISKSMCICGATNILADDLLPNKTLRDTINRILESGNSSTGNAGSTFQIQDVESAQCPQPKIPSPTSSAASKGEPKVSSPNEGTTNVLEKADDRKAVSAPQQTSEKVTAAIAADVSEATHESMSLKEPASQGNAQLVEEAVQQKLVPTEAGKKSKKKKIRLPANDLQWKTSQDLGAENYMIPMGPPPGNNSYWNGVQPGMEGFMTPYAGAMQMMGYGLGPLDMPFVSLLPQNPFGMQGYMLPVVPPHTHRDFTKDREFGREVSNGGDVSSMKSKTKLIPSSSSSDYQHHRSERLSPPREVEFSRPAKRKSNDDGDHHHRSESTSRLSSELNGKVTKVSDSDYESSDDEDEQNFKRRRSWREGIRVRGSTSTDDHFGSYQHMAQPIRGLNFSYA